MGVLILNLISRNTNLNVRGVIHTFIVYLHGISAYVVGNL